MTKNEDGSVVLTKEELEQLNKSYQSLYTILDDMPTFLGDFFEDHEEYVNVEKWHCLLNGEKFYRSDWE